MTFDRDQKTRGNIVCDYQLNLRSMLLGKANSNLNNTASSPQTNCDMLTLLAHNGIAKPENQKSKSNSKKIK